MTRVFPMTVSLALGQMSLELLPGRPSLSASLRFGGDDVRVNLDGDVIAALGTDRHRDATLPSRSDDAERTAVKSGEHAAGEVPGARAVLGEAFESDHGVVRQRHRQRRRLAPSIAA